MTHKIYADARRKIDGILKELLAEHCLVAAEIAYSVTKVEEELVVFKVHEKLKELIKEQYTLVGSGHNDIQFVEEPARKWSLIIRAGGVESHFFARLLEVVLKKLNEEKKEHVYTTKEIIRASINETLQKIHNGDKCQNRVWYKKGVYYAIVWIEGIEVKFQNHKNECPGSLRIFINEELPGIISTLAKNKKKKRRRR